MEVALRRRLDGVDTVAISQSEQRAEVTFTDGPRALVLATVRAAIEGAGMKLVALRVDACGQLETEGAERRLIAGENRFTLEGEAGGTVGYACVTGRLVEHTAPTPPGLVEVRLKTP
jgi:hypothetical protein